MGVVVSCREAVQQKGGDRREANQFGVLLMTVVDKDDSNREVATSRR